MYLKTAEIPAAIPKVMKSVFTRSERKLNVRTHQ